MGRRLDWQAFSEIQYTREEREELARRRLPPTFNQAVEKTLKSAAAALAEMAIEDVRRELQGESLRDLGAVAADLKLDLSRECPVCRSLERCDCSEVDRAFFRRTRFEPGVSGIPRCSSCRGPISTIYVPRHGDHLTDMPSLANFGAIHGCVICQGGALAAILAAFAKERS